MSRRKLNQADPTAYQAMAAVGKLSRNEELEGQRAYRRAVAAAVAKKIAEARAKAAE